MDRWLIRKAQRQPGADSRATANEEERAVKIADSETTNDFDSLDTRSAMKSIRWTPINHPWRRNSYNAALFDSHVSEGPYLTQDLSEISSATPRDRSQAAIAEDADDELDEARDKQHELRGEGEGAEAGELGVEDEHTSVDFYRLYIESERIFSDDPKFLRDVRLLTVAGLYTSDEIVEKVRRHHPQLRLPARITNITQTLLDSVTHVATDRGVAREEVKQELDSVRDATGVAERQTAHTKAKQRRAWEAKKAAEKRGFDVGTINIDGVAEEEPSGSVIGGSPWSKSNRKRRGTDEAVELEMDQKSRFWA